MGINKVMNEKKKSATASLKDWPHELVHETISKDNIDDFVRMKTARALHEYQVGRIKRLLDQKKHFSSPLVSNVPDGIKNPKRNEVVDGNHRIEAIKRKINEDPTFSIDVDIIRYHLSSNDDRAALFDRYNNGIAVKKIDHMVLHQYQLPAVRDMLEKYPIQLDIGGGVPDVRMPYVRLSAIVGAHVSARRKVGLAYALQMGWKMARMLDRKDYEDMVAFAYEFNTFASDQFRSRKTLITSSVLVILYRTWYLNCIDAPFAKNQKESIRKFTERAWDALHWERVISALTAFSRTSGSTAVGISAERTFVDAMNHGSKYPKIQYPSDFYGKVLSGVA
jgi:hypothetical protein